MRGDRSSLNPQLKVVDLHCHLIPGVDDGPRHLDATIELLEVAHRNGVRSLVATPHMFLEPYCLTAPDQVRQHFGEMIEALHERSQLPVNAFLRDLSFFLGAENYASQPFLEALERDAVLTLADSRYILVEFTPLSSLRQIRSVVERIQERDLVPVLAHVERYASLRDKQPEMEALLARGCLTQVNLGSLLLPRWSARGRLAHRLVQQDLITVIASDTHGAGFRPPSFADLVHKHSGRLGGDRLFRLCSANPTWVIGQVGS